jgi:hypothetical protein
VIKTLDEDRFNDDFVNLEKTLIEKLNSFLNNEIGMKNINLILPQYLNLCFSFIDNQSKKIFKF